MWRRGAPQRRGARGAFLGAEAHTSRYAMCRQMLPIDSLRFKKAILEPNYEKLETVATVAKAHSDHP